MTIETINRRSAGVADEGRADYLITCDGRGCKAALDAKDRTFQQAVTFLKAKGWTVRKVYSDWHHVCPICLGQAL